jgi:methyltransferase (TIGR00027 family)
MLQGQPSQTLLTPALARAVHRLRDAPLIFDDPIALQLLPEACGPDALARLGNHPELLRGLFAMRSRFAEDRLAESVRRGVRQYLIVGAGLDTFPWRQPSFAHRLHIVTLDHPASLAWSQALFSQRGFRQPVNLTCVPVDLEAGELAARLAHIGFDRTTVTFCSILGVLQYLQETSVKALLQFVAGLAPCSEIVCSFVVPDCGLEGEDLTIATAAAARAETIGEPWRTRLDASALVTMLRSNGFTDVFHLTPRLAQRRYFAGRRDQLRAPKWEQLIAAIM